MLLLDEALIDAESGIEREVHPGKKSDFVMEPDRDKPWEYSGPGMSKRIHLYGTTLYDDLMEKYRMWYFARMGPHWRQESGNYQIPGLYVPRTDEKPYNCNGVTQDKYGRSFVDNDRGDLTCYAESDDGINWVKPNLGIFTFDGSPQQYHLGSSRRVSFYDREEPNPNKRYKAIAFAAGYRNIFLITSPDGIHWDDKDNIEPVSVRGNEGHVHVIGIPTAGYSVRIRLFGSMTGTNRRVICYTKAPLLKDLGRTRCHAGADALGR